MILDIKPVSLAEVKEIVKSMPSENESLSNYIKVYCRLSPEKSKELKEEIFSLNNLKIKEDHAVKVADFLPKDSEDVNKIFNDVSLTEEEINAIVEIVKKY